MGWLHVNAANDEWYLKKNIFFRGILQVHKGVFIFEFTNEGAASMTGEILTNSLFKENIFKDLWKSISGNIFKIYMIQSWLLASSVI